MRLCECGCGREVKRRFVRGHATRGRLRLGGPEYTVSISGCWNWRGAKTVGGYGTRQRDGKTVYVFREYFERAHGPVPEEMVPDHLCRNPLCVNPDHMELVTHADNIRRGKGAKLTHKLAAEIRQAAGTQRELGLRYGVSHNVIGRIQRGESWAVS